MGFISGLLGNVAGGNAGANFQAQGPNAGLGGNQGQAAIGNAQANQAYNQQQNFVNQLNGINGIGALQGIANGTGPNPAQTLLNNATGANNAAQAALMAGQRGASANTGLIARQAAQQGAANEQNAIGQGAALQAQQSLNADTQLAGMQQQGLQNLNAYAQGNQQNANAALSSQNAVNAGIASGVAGNQASALGGLFGAAGQISGLLPMAAKAAPAAAAGAHGGSVERGKISPPQEDFHSKYRRAMSNALMAPEMHEGGKVPAILSPGEEYLEPEEARAVASGQKAPKSGKLVPGKPEVKGDSLKNDKVPASLSPGGVVVPRTKMQGSDRGVQDFVAAVLARQGLKGKRR